MGPFSSTSSIETKDIVLSMGNMQITGKDCIVRSMNVNIPCGQGRQVLASNGCPMSISAPTPPVEITLELVCSPEKFTREWWDEGYKPKISNKKVEDCTIQELLFAVRKKIK